jgi:uncharacterized membrane protein YedE/YeeE
MGNIIALAAGLLFGIGLIAGGMVDPGKVQGFLDVAGAWDPSLAFVMGGAIAVGAGAFALARRRGLSWTGRTIVLPPTRGVETRLVAGGVIFGVGWGLAGYCPGPAIVALGAGAAPALWFVPAMLAGVWLHDEWWAARAAAPPLLPPEPRTP